MRVDHHNCSACEVEVQLPAEGQHSFEVETENVMKTKIPKEKNIHINRERNTKD